MACPRSSDYPGITIEVLRLIEAKTDIKFIIQKRPWKRVVKEVRENHLDGGFHFSFKEERKSFVAYPIPEGKTVPDIKYSISNRSYLLYRLKGQAIHWDGKQVVMDTKGEISIGAIRGGSITDDIKQLGYKLHEVRTDQQLVMILLAKRVNAIIGLENMIDAKIKTLDLNGREQFEKTLPAMVSKPYYIAFSKKFYLRNSEKAWSVWKNIDHIKQHGELQKLYEKYSNK